MYAQRGERNEPTISYEQLSLEMGSPISYSEIKVSIGGIMYHKILCPIDGSETSKYCLNEAIKLAGAFKAKLCILHVVDTFYPYLDSIELVNYEEVTNALRKHGTDVLNCARKIAVKAGIEVETKLVEILNQKVSEAILVEARIEKSDLVVIGTHGRRGFDRLVMGSDAESVVRKCEVPVLTVRHPS
jgi:nucleotide-binding universal stress UspA family protein